MGKWQAKQFTIKQIKRLEEKIMYTKFSVKDGKVSWNKEKGKREISTFIGDDFNIVGYKINTDTSQITTKLQVFSIMAGKMVDIEVDRATVNAKQLAEKLKANFCTVLDANAMYNFFLEKEACLLRCQKLLERENSHLKIFDVFRELYGNKMDDVYNITESCGNREFVHTHMGWKKLDGKLTFHGAKSYCEDNLSTYVGNKKIEPVGDFNKIKNLFADIVSKNPKLQLASAMGVSATVLGFINSRWGMAIANPIYSLAGDTSMGKSTALELAVSQGGCPDGRKIGSMFHDFQGTENAVIKDMGNNTGFPIAVDDTKLADESVRKAMQKLLYALANGTDKKRVGAYGCGLQERDVFETAILISGEKSIFTYTKEIGGLAVRVLEFPDIFWTKDDKESDRVKAIVRENYGHITHRVAELLLDSIDTQEETTLKNSFEKWDKKFVSYAKKNNYYTPITDRVSRVLALLMISLEVLEKVVDVKLNAKSVYGILCKTILEHLFFESEQDNLADKGYALLREFYINNKKNLDCDEARGMFGGQASDYKGSIINKSKEVTFSISDEEITTSRCLGITKLQAERILVKEGHLSSVKAVMTALRKKGALCTKSSGNNVRNDANPFVIGDEKVSNGYQIYMPEEVYQDVTDIDNETDEGKIKKLYA